MNKKIDIQFVSFLRKMQNIQRLAGSFKHRNYDLTNHSFFVMQFFVMIAEEEGIPFTAKDLILTSRHDFVETITGDLLYPVKNLSKTTKDCWRAIEIEVSTKYPILREYTDRNLENGFSHPGLYSIMKAADILDLWIFCNEERNMGNKTKNLTRVIDECEKLLLEQNYSSVTNFIKEYTVD